jgi:tRNA-uridine 2-sulfurtransferase
VVRGGHCAPPAVCRLQHRTPHPHLSRFLTGYVFAYMKKKVFVGLSGGVDSAVAAKLLLDQGYNVTGVFIKIWQPEFSECTWEKDRLDAKRVAATLGITFLEVDFSEEYKQWVAEDMVRAYARGVTPNPDVLCNRFIKFGVFKDWAKERGADLIATGHHARILQKGNTHELHRGKDATKDQAYFLYRLTQNDLTNIVFPIGEYTKKEVRATAQRVGLPNANRPDSQGLCFVGQVSIGEFLSYYIPMQKGNVLDQKGNVVGTHEGSARYTIGERHGFTLDTPWSGRQDGAPHYITAIDTIKNTITVSPNLDDARVSSVMLKDVTWVNGKPTEGEYEAEVRYHQKPHCIRLMYRSDLYICDFGEPQIIASGQSVVLYEGILTAMPAHAGRCLGGGIVY